MLNALAATLALFGCCHSDDSSVGRLVAMAWQEADSQQDRRHVQDLKEDRELGQKYSAEVEKEAKLSKNTAMLERVQRIGKELADIANRQMVTVTWGDRRLNPFEYSFKLLEDKDVNAFSLPGGFIYVNEGLVDYAESDDEIAGVLAHEIAHASFRHIATLRREQEKLANVQLPLILIAIFTGGTQGASDAILTGQLVGAAKGSGWSVQAEQAADFGGFQYLLKSDYDPTGMLTFMERLARDERSRALVEWGIFRTHPPGKQRADALMRYMRDAGIPIRRSQVSTSFRASAKAQTGGAVEIQFGGKPIGKLGGADAAARAEVVTQRLNEFFDSMPELYDLATGENGAIIGRRATLMTITLDDASAMRKPLREAQEDVLRNLRTALFSLAYRTWDTRR